VIDAKDSDKRGKKEGPGRELNPGPPPNDKKALRRNHTTRPPGRYIYNDLKSVKGELVFTNREADASRDECATNPIWIDAFDLFSDSMDATPSRPTRPFDPQRVEALKAYRDVSDLSALC